MKKIIAVIPITILFILLSFNIKASAVTAGAFGWYIVYNPSDGTYNYHVIAYTFDHYREYPGYVLNDFYYAVDVWSGVVYNYDSAYNECNNFINNHSPSNYNPTDSEGLSTASAYRDKVLYIYNLPYQDLSGVDYEDLSPQPDESTWYDDMFESFLGAVEGIVSVATGGFSNLVEAFTEFWVVPVGGDEGDMFFPTDIVMASPTPTPTPIQYQTVIAPTTDPQGNVVYEYKYIYNNPSGTPIITSSPPVNNNGGGDSFDYPYYENPENNNNPYKLKIPWYLKLIFGNKIVDETTLDDSVNVIQDYMNDDDINDGVTTVYDGMSAIPTDWLILIGVIASIPLFGCLISRLLS